MKMKEIKKLKKLKNKQKEHKNFLLKCILWTTQLGDEGRLFTLHSKIIGLWTSLCIEDTSSTVCMLILLMVG